MTNTEAQVLNVEGNELFRKKLLKRFDPTCPTYWTNLAWCYDLMGGFPAMKAVAQECIRVHPTSRGGYFYKPLAQFGLLELHEAKRTIEKGTALDNLCDRNENDTSFDLK
jgi:putative component of membrane protein insertase Oxa1/YidC/SpoIIIJ protein YidD